MKILSTEVEKAWQLPLPIQHLDKIPGAVVSPLGLAEQAGIDENGHIIPKWRVTHDQSFAFSSGQSVNDRVIESELTPCQYGFALRRFLHTIIRLRQLYPTTPILLSKFNFKSAYRRIHWSATSAFQSIVTTTGLQDEPVALASLRATFGGAPCPSFWSEISESVTDLANVLVRCPHWDPKSLRPEHRDVIGNITFLANDIPFAPARNLLVDPGTDEYGTIDVYLDDLFSAFPALSDDHIERGSQAVPLAIDAVSRPLAQHESTLRDVLLALDKAKAEGTPSEQLRVLGWDIDTRRLLIIFPREKFIAWSRDIKTLISRGHNRVTHKELKTLIGRLQHVANVLTEGSHFLNHLRSAEMRAARHGGTRLTQAARSTLHIWLTFLLKAAKGIDINTIVSRLPDHIIRTDACEFGLGGYNLKTGRAWRYKIPDDCIGSKSINFLEFLACIIGIVLDVLESQDASPGDCYLSVGDNTSSLGWLHHSNFATEGDQTVHSGLARFFATFMAERGFCHYSQWFLGLQNLIADVCSRDHTTPDDILTCRLIHLYPSQTPPGFLISPLPPEISSFLDYWVRLKPGEMASPPELTKRLTPLSSAGSSSSTSANSPTTPFSTPTAAVTSTASSEPSPRKSESSIGQNPQRDMITWLKEHAVPPSRVYARPSSQMTGRIHPKIMTENLRSFYSANTKATRTTTPPSSHKKRSPSTSSQR
jgi:hypothetical protein